MTFLPRERLLFKLVSQRREYLSSYVYFTYLIPGRLTTLL